MTIKYSDGDIFTSGAECIVNPVNTVGVMGGGLALQFKKRFPENFEVYKDLCDGNLLKTGEIHLFMTDQEFIPYYIVNFPTKQHYKDPSLLEYIEPGLINMKEMLEMFDVKSVAIPALGCGLGGLNWNDVYPLIEKHFGESCAIEAIVFPPKEN